MSSDTPTPPQPALDLDALEKQANDPMGWWISRVDTLRLIATIRALQAERDALRNVCADVYQVFSALTAELGFWEQPPVNRQIVKLLDNLSAGMQGKPIPHKDVLPFDARAALAASRKGSAQYLCPACGTPDGWHTTNCPTDTDCT